MKKVNLKEYPWKACLALIMMGVSTYKDWYWFWGVAFLSMCWMPYKTGVLHFFEEVDKTKHPILFFMTLIGWVLLSVILIIYDISWRI